MSDIPGSRRMVCCHIVGTQRGNVGKELSEIAGQWENLVKDIFPLLSYTALSTELFSQGQQGILLAGITGIRDSRMLCITIRGVWPWQQRRLDDFCLRMGLIDIC